MLQPEYKRDMQKNYMIFREESGLDYCMKMLASNHIPGFLNLEIRSIDDKNEYYYDITGKQTLENLFQKVPFGEKQIRAILLEIIVTIMQSEEYLLLEDNFVLSPEYIFMDSEGTRICLLYYSGYEERVGEQLLRFMEYMMDRVDYKEKGAVYLIYGIYKLCREEGCTYGKILEYLNSVECLECDLKSYEAEEQEQLRQEELFAEVEEAVESEEEKKKYPIWVWGCSLLSILLSLGIIILAVQKGIVIDFITKEILWGKMAIVLGLTGLAESYCLIRLLEEKNKIAYIDRKVEYIKPVEERRMDKSPVCHYRKADEEEVEQATVMLAERKERYVLLPEKKEIYIPIYIEEFPFFIGSLKTKVDYAINSRNVSRFHAKLEREGEWFYLADLNSTNGTFINGMRMKPNERRSIALGDSISFADVVYRFEKE